MSSPGGPWDPRQQHSPGPSAYQGFGAFQQQLPAQPPKKRRATAIAGLAVAAVMLIGAGAAGAFLAVDGGERAAPPPQSPGGVPTSSVAEPGPAPPLAPGWQVAAAPEPSALYDVPPNWEIAPDPRAVLGYGDPRDAVTVTGVATFQRGFCQGEPNSYRATSGVTARPGPDDVSVAAGTSQKFIANAYARGRIAPVAEPSPPEHFQLPGGTPAVRINTRVTLPAPARCDAPTIAVSVVAAGNDGRGSVVLIAAADQGLPDSVSPEQLDRISGSLRR